ncbi:hypothetical protein Droror1_Dr00021598 [Drosera rotundifolia]
MESASEDDRRTRRSTRRQMIEKKKERDELIRAASSLEDPLDRVGSELCYHQSGLSVHFKSGCGDNLSCTLKQFISKLLKLNMERHYGMEWKIEERVKYREMLAPEARYIFALDTTFAEKSILFPTKGSEDTIVGFVHYRFTMEEEVPVLYLYELQLVPHVQGKGLGEFMMQLLELIARKMTAEKNYEILCKAFDHESQAKLE